MSAAPVPAEKGFTLGAEPKKVGALLLIMTIAGVLWWRNSSDSSAPSNVTPAPAVAKPGSLAAHQQQAAALTEAPPAGTRIVRRHGNQNERSVFEMRPIDPSRGDVDPTLRLDLLERLTTVKMAGGGRSLFESGTAPVPAMPQGGPGLKIHPGPEKPAPPPQPQPAPAHFDPPPPPIPLKFYGFLRPVNKGDLRRGFFMDGDVIVVATEGETIKQRYRVVKFLDTSATMEDTVTKNQQTLPIVPEARGEN